MTSMENDLSESLEAALDRAIEMLIGKEMRGEAEPRDHIMLQELLARRSRLMRPDRTGARHSEQRMRA